MSSSSSSSNSSSSYSTIQEALNARNSTIGAALFVDNSQSNIENMKLCNKEGEEEKMTTLKVADSGLELYMIKFYNSEDHRLKEFKDIMEDKDQNKNFFYKVLYYLTDGTYYDKISGISEADCAFIIEWVSARKAEGKQPAVIFDFDRTLSQSEGIDIFGNPSSLDEYILELMKYVGSRRKATYYKEGLRNLEKLIASGSDAIYDMILSYYVGGEKRLNYLRQMFYTLRMQNVSIFVLTNNPQCKNYNDFYKDFLKKLFGMENFRLICGTNFGNNKALAAASNEFLKNVCSYTAPPPSSSSSSSSSSSTLGGKRRLRKTRKHKAKRKARKTRKH